MTVLESRTASPSCAGSARGPRRTGRPRTWSARRRPLPRARVLSRCRRENPGRGEPHSACVPPVSDRAPRPAHRPAPRTRRGGARPRAA